MPLTDNPPPLLPMPSLQLEELKIDSMASGDSCLLLTTRIDWDNFVAYANALVRLLGAKVESRSRNVVDHLWTVTLYGEEFWLVFDDFPFGVSLEPQNSSASALIPGIRETLIRYRGED